MHKERFWLVESSQAKNRTGKVGGWWVGGGWVGGWISMCVGVGMCGWGWITHTRMTATTTPKHTNQPPPYPYQLQPTAYKLMARDPVTVMARPESAIMR